jgi:hypothetical protein
VARARGVTDGDVDAAGGAVLVRLGAAAVELPGGQRARALRHVGGGAVVRRRGPARVGLPLDERQPLDAEPPWALQFFLIQLSSFKFKCGTITYSKSALGFTCQRGGSPEAFQRFRALSATAAANLEEPPPPPAHLFGVMVGLGVIS